MCGIAGAVFWDPQQAPEDPVGMVARMAAALGHRGPDGDGVVSCGGLGGDSSPIAVFGHRRLAIIDLSDRARQPMAHVRRGLWLTYNGEIYNYRALRRELEAVGRVFESDSDTEVILHGYDTWGRALLDRLRGMFAFAIWDRAARELTLVRDRLGIKPLYVAESAGQVLFASEVRALVASGLIARAIDPVALTEYLTYQTVPAPRTMVRDVRMLLPGHVVTARGRTPMEARPYWDLLDSRLAEGADTGPRESRARLGHLLSEAIAGHLVSDVPVGVFLSGGIDSSALVSLVSASGVVPRTFAVTFPGTPYDEGPYARLVATAFKTEHTEVPVRSADAVEGVEDALNGLDQPSGDGINTFLVARAVRSTGIKVALSGLGGDELFGGYPSFSRLDRLSGYATALKQSPAAARHVAAAVMKLVGRSVSSSKAAALLETDGSVPEAFPILRQLFAPAERAALLAPRWRDAGASADPYVELLQRAVDRRGDAELMTMISYAETRTYLHDLLLRDTDQMSMCHGLEVRVPFLDHPVVEYVMGLGDAVKRPAGVPKRLLIESLPSPLPDASTRRRKQGFELPLAEWMRTDLRGLCEKHLGPSGLAGSGLLEPQAVQRLWRAFLAADRRTSWSRPWALVALGAWLDRNGLEARV